MSRRWGKWPAILVSAVAFSAWHQDLPSAHVMFLAGLVYAWTSETSGSVVPALLVHTRNNAAAIPLPPVMSVPAPVHAGVLLLCAAALAASIAAARRALPITVAPGVGG